MNYIETLQTLWYIMIYYVFSPDSLLIPIRFNYSPLGYSCAGVCLSYQFISRNIFIIVTSFGAMARLRTRLRIA